MGPQQPTLPPSCIYPSTGLPAVPVHVLEPGAPPSRSPQAQGAGGGERCEQRMRAQFEALNGGSLSSHRRGSKLVGGGAGAAPRDRVRQLNLGEKIPGGGRGHEGRRGLAGGTGVRGGQAHTGHGVFLKKMFKHDIVTQPCSSKN